MKNREHWWVIAAILILTLTSAYSLTKIQNDLQDHEGIDRHACQLALKNREILSGVITTLVEDEGGRTAATQATLTKLNQQLKALIEQAHSCADD